MDKFIQQLTSQLQIEAPDVASEVVVEKFVPGAELDTLLPPEKIDPECTRNILVELCELYNTASHCPSHSIPSILCIVSSRFFRQFGDIGKQKHETLLRLTENFTDFSHREGLNAIAEAYQSKLSHSLLYGIVTVAFPNEALRLQNLEAAATQAEAEGNAQKVIDILAAGTLLLKLLETEDYKLEIEIPDFIETQAGAIAFVIGTISKIQHKLDTIAEC